MKLQNKGLNLEYTASNDRIKEEIPISLTPMSQAIERVFYHYLALKDTLDVREIDSRWK